MGVSKFDNEAAHRKLSARYALDNPKGIRLLLGEISALSSRRFNGDYAASDILIDLETAISKASLTDRQRQALKLVFEEDLTQAEAGKRMNIVQKNVSEALERAIKSIADVYFYWANHGEGYDIVKTKGDGIDDEQISAT